MKLLTTIAAFAVSATTAMADPVFGTWESPVGETGGYLHVKIEACGNKICGTIVDVFENDNKSSVGKQMISGMKPSGNGVYKGGKVWAPDQDKTYRGKLTLTSGGLKVEGCVLGGAVCRGETFSRVN